MAFNGQEWKDKKPEGKNFENDLIEEGSYPARLARVIELGDQDTPYGVKSQVKFMFTIPSISIEINGEKKQRVINTFPVNIPDTFNDDSTLGKIIDALNPAMVGWSDLIGKECLISIKQETSKKDSSKKYNKITSYSKPIAGMNTPEPDCDTYVYEIDNGEDAVFDMLGDWLKEQIRGAKNFGQ